MFGNFRWNSKLSTAGNFRQFVRFVFSECRMNSSHFGNSTTEIFWMLSVFRVSESLAEWEVPLAVYLSRTLTSPPPPCRCDPSRPLCTSTARVNKPRTTSWWSRVQFCWWLSKRFSRLYILVVRGDLVSSAFSSSLVQFSIIDNYKQKHLEISISCTLHPHVKKENNTETLE